MPIFSRKVCARFTQAQRKTTPLWQPHSLWFGAAQEPEQEQEHARFRKVSIYNIICRSRLVRASTARNTLRYITFRSRWQLHMKMICINAHVLIQSALRLLQLHLIHVGASLLRRCCQVLLHCSCTEVVYEVVSH